MPKYVAVVCSHLDCQQKQAVNVEEKCKKKKVIVLHPEERKDMKVVVTCERCKREFPILIDCTEYQS